VDDHFSKSRRKPEVPFLLRWKAEAIVASVTATRGAVFKLGVAVNGVAGGSR
jgi:hypothetical protein